MGGRSALIVLDTHAWVWWTDVPRKLSRRAAEAIGAAETLGIPAISCLEFVQLVERRRLTPRLPPERWVVQALAQDRVAALPLTPEIAIAAGLLDREGFHPDPADRMIYATARAHGARLVTKDERLRRFDPRLTLW